MANYLAQFQTIKNSLDHLVIAGQFHNFAISFNFLGCFFSSSFCNFKFELKFIVELFFLLSIFRICSY